MPRTPQHTSMVAGPSPPALLTQHVFLTLLSRQLVVSASGSSPTPHGRRLWSSAPKVQHLRYRECCLLPQHLWPWSCFVVHCCKNYIGFTLVLFRSCLSMDGRQHRDLRKNLNTFRATLCRPWLWPEKEGGVLSQGFPA